MSKNVVPVTVVSTDPLEAKERFKQRLQHDAEQVDTAENLQHCKNSYQKHTSVESEMLVVAPL